MLANSTIHVVESDKDQRGELLRNVASDTRELVDYSTAEQFLEYYDDEGEHPRCLVAADSLPDINGLELQCRLAEQGALIPVVLLTNESDQQTAVESMRQGAIGVLQKPVAPDVLRSEVGRGLSVDAGRRKRRRQLHEYRQRLATLSKRQREVLELAKDGLSIKEMSGVLQVCFQTVAKHRAHVFRILGVRNEAEFVRTITRFDGRNSSEAVPNRRREFTTGERHAQ